MGHATIMPTCTGVSCKHIYKLTCLATCIAVNVLKSIEDELCPLDGRLFVGVGDNISDLSGAGLADIIREGVKGRECDWRGVEGLLDVGDCEPDVG